MSTLSQSLAMHNASILQGKKPQEENHSILHYSPYSLYSIIVRLALGMGQKLNPDTAPEVHLQLVNVQQGDNLTHEYLTLTPKGQVPVLKTISPGQSEGEVLAESQDILSWLCGKQPELMPETHQEEIQRALDMFYSFHAKPLAIRPEEKSGGIVNHAAAMLENPDITDAHRRCLEVKSIFHDTLHSGSQDPDTMREVESQARLFLDAVTEILDKRDGGGIYLYGASPTVLDAVAVSLVARLVDVDRTNLLTDTLTSYHDRIRQTREWTDVVPGLTII